MLAAGWAARSVFDIAIIEGEGIGGLLGRHAMVASSPNFISMDFSHALS